MGTEARISLYVDDQCVRARPRSPAADRLLVVDNGEIKQAGIVPFVGNSWLYPAWSAMNGGKIFDAASNKYMIDSDNNVQWLEYWVKWLDTQYGGDLEKLTPRQHFK